ncbi:hypothetical protein VNO77_25907 [Canavalia gladiata]|uniref:Uncharacterized protein n=1 Tax=Canavalia gladiata TaxID=3824 RepID=A0AAN9KW47_CANGL
MEEGNIGEPLLKKKYYENCPGCKVDEAKELKKDVTFRNLLNLWIVVLCSALPISSLFPFLYFMVVAAWGVGLVFGPALGGYLAQPTEKYPYLFPKGSIWDKFPYFLPCFVISMFALAVAIACIWLPETLHNHSVSIDNIEVLESGSNVADNDKTTRKDESLFRNWPLMSSILVFCVVSLHDVAYSEVFSLWAVSPRKLGGLNFTTDDVGNVLAISGLSIIIFQLGIYQSLQRICGPIVLARIAGMLAIPILQSYPFMAKLSGFKLYILIYIASILKNVMTEIISTAFFILQNIAVEQHQRGVANGICMTAMSAFKVIGPAAGGAILTLSQKRLNASFLPGTHLVFFALNAVEGLGVLLMFKPFLTTKKKIPTEQLH